MPLRPDQERFAPAPLLFSQTTTPPRVAAGPKEERAKPGINENFLDPALDIDEWLKRFEVESREVYSSLHRTVQR